MSKDRCSPQWWRLCPRHACNSGPIDRRYRRHQSHNNLAGFGRGRFASPETVHCFGLRPVLKVSTAFARPVAKRRRQGVASRCRRRSSTAINRRPKEPSSPKLWIINSSAGDPAGGTGQARISSYCDISAATLSCAENRACTRSSPAAPIRIRRPGSPHSREIASPIAATSPTSTVYPVTPSTDVSSTPWHRVATVARPQAMASRST